MKTPRNGDQQKTGTKVEIIATRAIKHAGKKSMGYTGDMNS